MMHENDSLMVLFHRALFPYKPLTGDFQLPKEFFPNGMNVLGKCGDKPSLGRWARWQVSKK